MDHNKISELNEYMKLIKKKIKDYEKKTYLRKGNASYRLMLTRNRHANNEGKNIEE